MRLSWLLLTLLCLPLVVGCEGCRPTSDGEQQADEDEDDSQQSLQDFTSEPATVFPADRTPLGSGIKPGHWFTASQTLKSNKLDIRGELQGVALADNPVRGAGNASVLTSMRPAVLPRGQQRRFDYRLIAPLPRSAKAKQLYLSNRFVSTERSAVFEAGAFPTPILAEEEYLFVVLTQRPDRFARLQVADWVEPYRDELQLPNDRRANYRLVFPPSDGVLPLPETMLDWTSTAVVLWDDLRADALTPSQTQALADWTHFGGRLIINGVRAAEAISQSTLADLLPLRPTSSIELNPDAAEELLRGWSVKTDHSTDKQVSMVHEQTGRVSLDGKLADDARVVEDTGGLMMTQRSGRGSVVQSRFDLTSDWIENWHSYDSFFNGVILGRPNRKFFDIARLDAAIEQRYADEGTPHATPMVNTGFRITARDLSLPPKGDDEGGQGSAVHANALVVPRPVSGVGGWTDDSQLLSLFQEILQSEAGIEIPDSKLVVWALGIYLLLLVPVNYVLFRLMGRVEYAWLAVPLIAIIGAVWVARAARLDIGFARSNTEMALLELQPNHQRGHLSRMLAIYNSLSSRYDLSFDTPDSVAAPVRSRDEGLGQTRPVFETAVDIGPTLAGVAVSSNRIRLVHAEQVIDAGGTLEIQDGELANNTNYELLDSLVIEKDEAGNVRAALLGLIGPGEQVPLRYQSNAPATADDLPMHAERILSRLASPAAMAPGTSRFVGRIDGAVPGMAVRPTASQQASQTIVLAHLKHAALEPPEPDINLLSDFGRSQTEIRRVPEDDGEASLDILPQETP